MTQTEPTEHACVIQDDDRFLNALCQNSHEHLNIDLYWIAHTKCIQTIPQKNASLSCVFL